MTGAVGAVTAKSGELTVTFWILSFLLELSVAVPLADVPMNVCPKDTGLLATVAAAVRTTPKARTS